MDFHRILMIAIGVLAAAFLVLFTLAIVRRDRPEAPALWRSGTGALALAGLLFILSGVIGNGDVTLIACGFMFLVFATGTQLAPVRDKGAPKA